ncbi:hypothetical protein BsWGS_10591 [Bradybaena similaris]
MKLLVAIMFFGVMCLIYCILQLSTFVISNGHVVPGLAADKRNQLPEIAVFNTENEHTATADECFLRDKPLSEESGEKSLAKRLPTCLIIGFAKCGTYALKSFLTLHPDIVCPNHEVQFFTEYYNRGLDWYREQMPVSLESQVTIEKTPSYILSPKALSRIRRFNASIKLIVIVRNPLVRLQSIYAHALDEEPGFNETFASWTSSEKRIAYIADYAKHIKDVLRLFNANQVMVVEEEELEQRPLRLLRNVERFLGLCHAFTEDLIVFNPDKGFYCFNKSSWRYRELERTLTLDRRTGCFSRNKGREHPQIERRQMQQLVLKLSPYNEKLFALLGKRFNWTSPDIM